MKPKAYQPYHPDLVKEYKDINQLIQAPVTKRWRSYQSLKRFREYHHQGSQGLLPEKNSN